MPFTPASQRVIGQEGIRKPEATRGGPEGVGDRPVEPVAPKLGFLSRVSRDIKRRGERFAESKAAQKRGEQTPIETGIQLAGETIGGIFDVAFEGVVSAGRKIAPLTQADEKIKEAFDTPTGQAALNALNKGTDAYMKWRKENPRFARNFEAGFEIFSALPALRVTKETAEVGVKVAKKTVGALPEEVGRAAEIGAEAAERKLAEQVTREAVQVTKPKRTIGEKTAELEAGRGEVKGILREAKLQPSAIDIKVAKSVEDVIKPSNNFVDNIDAIRNKIEKSSEKIGEKLRGNNTIFNNNQLKKKLGDTKEESRVVFGSDKTLETNYDAVVDEFIRISNKHPKNLEGLWQARIEFDQVMKKKFPNIFDKIGGDAIRSNAVLDVRRAANDFIAEKLPKGDKFREELFEISDMFTARKNIAKNAAGSVDVPAVDKIMRVIRANPITSFATGGIVTIGALTSMLVSPLVLGSLFVVGAVKVGNKIISARILKQALSKGLRGLEKTLKSDEKKAFEDIIEKLDKAPDVSP